VQREQVDAASARLPRWTYQDIDHCYYFTGLRKPWC